MHLDDVIRVVRTNAAALLRASVALAHGLGVPALGYGGLTSSKVDDAQAGLEEFLREAEALSRW